MSHEGHRAHLRRMAANDRVLFALEQEESALVAQRARVHAQAQELERDLRRGRPATSSASVSYSRTRRALAKAAPESSSRLGSRLSLQCISSRLGSGSNRNPTPPPRSDPAAQQSPPILRAAQGRQAPVHLEGESNRLPPRRGPTPGGSPSGLAAKRSASLPAQPLRLPEQPPGGRAGLSAERRVEHAPVRSLYPNEYRIETRLPPTPSDGTADQTQGAPSPDSGSRADQDARIAALHSECVRLKEQGEQVWAAGAPPMNRAEQGEQAQMAGVRASNPVAEVLSSVVPPYAPNSPPPALVLEGPRESAVLKPNGAAVLSAIAQAGAGNSGAPAAVRKSKSATIKEGQEAAPAANGGGIWQKAGKAFSLGGKGNKDSGADASVPFPVMLHRVMSTAVLDREKGIQALMKRVVEMEAEERRRPGCEAEQKEEIIRKRMIKSVSMLNGPDPLNVRSTQPPSLPCL